MNPALSAVNRDFSRRYNDIPKLVVSDHYEIPEDHPWRGTASVVTRTALRDRVEREKGADGGPIIVFASHILWNGLLVDGLVDTIDLVVGPDAPVLIPSSPPSYMLLVRKASMVQRR